MHVYLHIPFCREKCTYCKFALTPVFDDLKKKRYLKYLKQEIKNTLMGISGEQYRSPKTIYFGGGTPSILRIEEVTEILACFERNTEREISFECNPEGITEEYIQNLIQVGINRLSIGIQSLNNDTLSEIHRSNQGTIFQALDTVEKILQNTDTGISVNIDLILGLPCSKYGETLSNIELLHKKYPCITHTSVYMLEDGIYPKNWKEKSISEEQLQSEFLEIMTYFEKKDWNHYELSNFAKPGYECQHNKSYWNHSNSRGFGLSASSYEDKKRWSNSPSFSGYYKDIRVDEEALSDTSIEIETLMFGLRTGGYTCHHDILSVNPKALQKYTTSGHLIQKGDTIFLTKTGIFMANPIMSELIVE